MVYITEYITKSPLKTHNIFEAVKGVFDRQKLFLETNDKEGDVARKLLTRVVNALVAKQHIGGPLACHFIQGFPDHYTDVDFKVLHWCSFVRHVSRSWEGITGITSQNEESVMLRQNKNEILSHSRVQDYVHRPFEMEAWSLYEFLRFSDMKLMSPKRKQATYVFLKSLLNGMPLARPALTFHHKHPNVATHDIRILSREEAKTLTLVGGTLPRKDGDDVEEYSKVMLVFFSPSGWRTGLELKNENEDWTSAFNRTHFSPKALEVMNNMHALYECRDERHDLAAKRRGGVDIVFPGSILNDTVDRLDEDAYVEQQMRGHEVLSARTVNALADAAAELSSKMRTVFSQMNDMRKLMDTIPDVSNRLVETAFVNEHLDLFPHLDRSAWKQILTRAREEAIQSRIPQYTPSLTSDISSAPRSQEGVVQVIQPSHLLCLSDHYMRRDYSKLTPTALVEEVANDFGLNEDQRRAYRLTSRDILTPSIDRLRLILAGMAGTGKTRVIKALIALLAARNESYRFVVMAPTGSAAALVHGSTYHSVLAFGHDNKDMTDNVRDRLRKRLEHVDLFFLDEMSMISCRELYAISRRLSLIFGNTHLSFGGKTMILAGDFAQLPPISKNGPPLYSTKVGCSTEALSAAQEKDSLGKAVWFEFSHVVILRENMRQTGASENEIKFRRLLDNLRYADCTKEDLALLHSRVLSDSFPPSILNKPEFKYVSILTGLNSHRDAINDHMSAVFSRDHDATLEDLHSIDRWNVDKYLSSLPPCSREQQVTAVRNLQRYLWKLPPSVTSQSAGILSICLNMPVMLKHNEATEVCATNGAEGKIVGFHTRSGLHGKKAIETIFVELINPPKNIQIDNLPVNVVPVNPSTKSISCPLGPSRSFLNVRREQVELLPNFAMSDYCSQGRTRPYNIVDLTTCRSHQSIYTCLSRAASFEGTVILRQFSDRLLTCGASSDLKKEFRELEILDHLTNLEFKGRLPANTIMTDRRAAVSYYVNAVGGLYMPPKAHQALVDKNLRPRKHVGDLAENLPNEDPLERIPERPTISPVFRLKWDRENWSCAYDSVMFIVWTLIEDDHLTVDDFNHSSYLVEGTSLISELLRLKSTGSSTMQSMNQIRLYWRTLLSARHPQAFPRYGTHGAAVTALLESLFRHEQAFGYLKKTCVVCNSVTVIHDIHTLLWPTTLQMLTGVSREGIVHSKDVVHHLLAMENIGMCTTCRSLNSVWNYFDFATPPELLIIEFNPDDLNLLSLVIDQYYFHRQLGTYCIQAVIYLGGFHFAVRVFRPNGAVWKHDGTQHDGMAFPERIYDGDFDLSQMDG
ncbi:hypothetical protein NLI96_g7082 [Meripilus lineatus]|uniref:ATP-dependent DNA helicase n=1 Tax=Meripilus lineatus TaxID=2056292 RepID=A0AAD5V1L5_9APHY|nr:hypothetical protein NLI96_g7082 [Physisporinus lineatus]